MDWIPGVLRSVSGVRAPIFTAVTYVLGVSLSRLQRRRSAIKLSARVLLWTLAALSLFAPGATGQDCSPSVQMELSPSPSFEDQEVVVRLFGSWPVLNPPQISSSFVSGAVIGVELLGSSTGPAAMLDSWEGTISVGPLDAGTYELLVDLIIDQGTAFESNLVCGPIPHLVVSGVAVPGLGPAGIVVLALAITGLAIPLIRRL